LARHDQLGVEPAGLADDRRKIAVIGEVDRIAGHCLIRAGTGAGDMTPFDLDAVLGEFLLDETMTGDPARHPRRDAPAEAGTRRAAANADDFGRRLRHGDTRDERKRRQDEGKSVPIHIS
jgi:hypothetical protein